ncbi:GNAT family N-acetyltransferase [Myxococcaceae bacterium GXIMD 01537]
MAGTRRADLLTLLEQSPPGTRLWVRGAGRSLYPLLRSGDSVQVERCGPDDLARGDVALVRMARGFSAHVVTATRPLVTQSMLGGVDPEGGVALGRVVAVRRGRLVIPLPRPARPMLFLTQRALASAWARPEARHLYRRVRDATFSGWSLPLRRWTLGPLEVRLLGQSDLDPLLVFAGARLQVTAAFLRHQLRVRWADEHERAGAAVGAFDARGRLHAFAWMDDYRQEGLNLEGLWVRSLMVAPQARRMGVATRLLARLETEAQRQGAAYLYADIDEDNTASLGTFRGAGYLLASEELTRRVNAEWDAAGARKPLVVMVRTLG